MPSEETVNPEIVVLLNATTNEIVILRMLLLLLVLQAFAVDIVVTGRGGK